jgi:hypothetical protein
MNCDYTGPNYSPEDLRSVIDAMCKSLESSGQIDEHEHPSAYSALLDTSKWMAELEGQEPVAWVEVVSTHEGPYNFEGMALLGKGNHLLYARPVPAEMSPDFTDTARAALLWVLWHHQGGSSPVGQPIRYALGMDAHEHLSKHQVQEAKRWAALTKSESNDFRQARTAPPEPVNARLLAVATGKIPHLYEGRCPDYVNGPESRDPDCPACQAIAAAEAQQERLLQDMHDAGREINRVMAESAPKAVRLTDADLQECKRLADAGSPVPRMSWSQRLAFAIETAVLRKNGIEVAE